MKSEKQELDMLQQIEALDKLSRTYILTADHSTGKFYRNDTEEITQTEHDALADLARKLAPFHPLVEELPGRVEMKSSMHLIKTMSRDAIALI